MPAAPQSIFLIQPSHIGDLLVDTPLFATLHARYPGAKLVVGTGRWNFETIRNNPHVDEVIEVNCPWNNIFVNPKTLRAGFRFVAPSSPVVGALRARKFDLGIDLIGTQFDALLLLNARIPYRIGIKGSGGGFTSFQWSVREDWYQPMAATALRLAEHLGAAANELPPIYPQIFLTEEERRQGESTWTPRSAGRKRIVFGPAGSHARKLWPQESFEELLLAMRDPALEIILVGGHDTVEAAARLARLAPAVRNMVNGLPLRQTFALVASADVVISNSNMLMHAAAAFRVPSIVVLGAMYESAAQHKLQWGYPGTVVLGAEAERPALATAAEVLEHMHRLLGAGGAALRPAEAASAARRADGAPRPVAGGTVPRREGALRDLDRTGRRDRRRAAGDGDAGGGGACAGMACARRGAGRGAAAGDVPGAWNRRDDTGGSAAAPADGESGEQVFHVPPEQSRADAAGRATDRSGGGIEAGRGPHAVADAAGGGRRDGAGVGDSVLLGDDDGDFEPLSAGA